MPKLSAVTLTGEMVIAANLTDFVFPTGLQFELEARNLGAGSDPRRIFPLDLARHVHSCMLSATNGSESRSARTSGVSPVVAVDRWTGRSATGSRVQDAMVARQATG
jgi:hypothetical protein